MMIRDADNLPMHRSRLYVIRLTPRRSAARFLVPVWERRLVARSAAVAGRGSARRPVRSSAAVLAPPTSRTRRDTCSSSITLIMRSAWRPGDSRHRHMLRRRPLIHHPPHMPHHQGIPQAQAIPRHRAIRCQVCRITGDGLNRSEAASPGRSPAPCYARSAIRR
jgi:hypothetical protein